MMAVCIVQARLNSTRLPRKVLLPLNGHTVLNEVLERCKTIPGIDRVVCAVPDGETELIDCALKFGVTVIAGPEHDVLTRYYRAARATDADIVLRVTADCPLISPELCGEVLATLKRENAGYASNVWPRTFPKGVDCEAFTFKTLRDAYLNSTEREHVTTWMLTANIKRANVASPWKLDGRLTLDTADDYRTICAAFGHQPYERLRAA